MPPVVGAIASFAGWVVFEVVGLKAVLGTIALVGYNSYQARKIKKAMRQTPDIRKEVTQKSATESAAVIYGTMASGGLLTHYNVAGTDNKDLWMTVTYAYHSCNDITSLWLDDREVTAANIGTWSEGSTGKTVESGSFYANSQGWLTLYKFLGDAAQTHNTAYASAITEWTAAHDGESVTYLQFKATLEEDSSKVYESGAPRTVRAVVEGKDDIYDPRIQFPAGTVTQGSVDQSNATYQISSNSWSGSDNPILQVADYMVNFMNIPASEIDWQTVLDEADYCDFQVNTSDADTQEKRFTSNGLLLLSNSHAENISSILASCNGRVGYKNGLYQILAGRLGTGPNLITNPTMSSTTGWTSYNAGTMTAVSGNLRLQRTDPSFGATTPVSTTAGSYYVATCRLDQPTLSLSNDMYLIADTTATPSAPYLASDNETGHASQMRIGFVAEGSTTYIGLEVQGSPGVNAWFDDVECYLVTDIEVNESWLRDDVGIATAKPKNERFNNARGFYYSAAEDYKQVQSMEVRNTAFESRDNSERLWADFALPFTTSEDEAQRLLHKRIQANDEQLTLNLRCNYKALQVTANDWVMVTLSEFGWTQKLFRVVSCVVTQAEGVDLVLVEDSPDAYQDPNTNDYSTRTPSGMTFGVAEVPDPSSVTLTARTNLPDMVIAWTPPAPQYYDVAEIWRNTSNSFGGATKIGEVRASTYTDTTAAAGTTYYYWVRLRYGLEYSTEVATTPTNSAAASIVATEADAVEWENVQDAGGTRPVDNATNNGVTIDDQGRLSGDMVFNSGNLRVGKTSAADTTNAGIWIGSDGTSDYDIFASDAGYTTGFRWIGSTGSLTVKGTITIANQSDIDTSAINNDAGWTDDTAADAAQADATTGLNRSQNLDSSGDISGGMTLSGGSISVGKTATSDFTNAGIWIGDDGAGGNDFYIGTASDSTYIKWDGSAGTLNMKGTIIIDNPSAIDGSTINNDSGWTDDTAADAAQSTADTASTNATDAQNKSQNFDTNGDINNAVTMITGASIGSGQTAYNTGTGFWLETNGGTPRMSIGNGTSGFTWDGTTFALRGNLTIDNPGDINTSAINNDAGWTDDAAADAAQAIADAANSKSTHYDLSGNITGGIQMTGSGTITLSSAGHIKGGQTAYNTGTGFFLGYSGAAYKFSIGDGGTTNYMTWDGTTLTVGGDLVVQNAASVRGDLNVADGSTNNGGTIDTSGNIIGGVEVDTGGQIFSGQTAYNVGTGFWLEANSGTPRMSLGNGTSGFTWDGTTFTVRGNMTIDNPSNINSSAINNDAGFTDDTAADAAQADATTAVNASQHYDSSGNITGGILMTGSGTITLSSAGHIKGGQTAYATGSGFFLGYSGGAYQFSIGDGTNYLRYNTTGGTLEIAGDISILNPSDVRSDINVADGSTNNGSTISTGGDITGGIQMTGSGTITMSSAGHIKGGQTAYNTGTGFFLGYSGAAYKFSIGDTDNYMTWDGSTFTVRGNVDIPQESNITLEGSALNFIAINAWTYLSDVEGWTGSNLTRTHQGDGTVLIESTSTDPQFLSPSSLSIDGSANYYVRVRLKRQAGSSWDGVCYFTTTTNTSFSGSYYKQVSDPTGGTDTTNWHIVEFDMSNLTVGTTQWTSGTVTRLRLDLGSSATDDFLIDWVAIGRRASVLSSNNIAYLDGNLIGDLQPAEVDADVTVPATGSWTPTFQDASFSDSESQTYTTQVGHYAKLGSDLVMCTFDIDASSLGTLSGSVYLAGLPFTSSASLTYPGGGTIYTGQGLNLNNASENLVLRVNSNVTYCQLLVWDLVFGTSALQISEMGGSDRLTGLIVYRI